MLAAGDGVGCPARERNEEASDPSFLNLGGGRANLGGGRTGRAVGGSGLTVASAPAWPAASSAPTSTPMSFSAPSPKPNPSLPRASFCALASSSAERLDSCAYSLPELLRRSAPSESTLATSKPPRVSSLFSSSAVVSMNSSEEDVGAVEEGSQMPTAREMWARAAAAACLVSKERECR